MADAPSGRQYTIAYEDQEAVVVEVGGGIRAYRHGNRDVLQDYAVGAICDGAHGTPLVPWPNRLGDGRFTFDGVEHQVPLTEPEKANAIHGFGRWRSWELMRREPHAVTMRAAFRPMPFFPFALDVQLDYELGADGLTVTTTGHNRGGSDAPWACGQHPYLSPGPGTIDDATLTFRAGTRIDTDDRQLPTSPVPVAGSPYDFGAGQPVGSTSIDYAFTDLTRDCEGRAWLTLGGVDGRVVEAWIDASYPYLEVFTADGLSADRARRGLGVEPMSCPPNGLQSGTDVVRLAPGASVTHRWGVRLRAEDPPGRSHERGR